MNCCEPGFFGADKNKMLTKKHLKKIRHIKKIKKIKSILQADVIKTFLFIQPFFFIWQNFIPDNDKKKLQSKISKKHRFES